MTHFWHRNLNKGEGSLLSSPCDLNSDLFIAWQRPLPNGESYYSYKCFTDFDEFWSFFQSQPKERQCFHEVTLSYRGQKLRFDVDIPGSDDLEAGQIIIEELMEACIKTFKKYSVKLKVSRDFLLCSSHSLDARHPKLSYHLILPHYRFSSCHAVKQIFTEVVSEMSDEAASLLDAGVYNPNHMLRTLYSYKFGEMRQKEVERTFSFRGRTITTEIPNDDDSEIEWLKASLITWSFEAKKIKVVIPVEEKLSASIEVADSSIQAAVKLLVAKDTEGIWEADLDNVSGPIVPLRRQLDDDNEKKANKCWICRDDKGQPRIHTSDNAYLLVFAPSPASESVSMGKVYFCCHRAAGEKYDLGQVDFEAKKDSDDSEEEEKEELPIISTGKTKFWREQLTGDTRLTRLFTSSG